MENKPTFNRCFDTIKALNLEGMFPSAYKYCYGEFCAGQVAVFDLDEVRKYNPDIDDWMASHKWYTTVIPDFDGEVEYQISDNGGAHIVISTLLKQEFNFK